MEKYGGRDIPVQMRKSPPPCPLLPFYINSPSEHCTYNIVGNSLGLKGKLSLILSFSVVRGFINR